MRFYRGDRVVVASPVPTTPHRAFIGKHGSVEKRDRADEGVWVQLDGLVSPNFFGDFELEVESIVDQLARLA